MLKKVSISDKCCSFELSIHQIILNKKYHGFQKKKKKTTTKKAAAQLFSTLIIIRNVSSY